MDSSSGDLLAQLDKIKGKLDRRQHVEHHLQQQQKSQSNSNPERPQSSQSTSNIAFNPSRDASVLITSADVDALLRSFSAGGSVNSFADFSEEEYVPKYPKALEDVEEKSPQPPEAKLHDDYSKPFKTPLPHIELISDMKAAELRPKAFPTADAVHPLPNSYQIIILEFAYWRSIS